MRVRRNAGGSTMRLVAATMIAIVLAAGCGGGDDDDASTPDVGSDTQTDTDSAEGDSDAGAESSDESAGDDGGSTPAVDAAAAGTATVTIGDVTYVADQQVVCVQIGEAIGGSWNDAAGDIAISIDLPPQDWETSPDGWTAPSVRVDDDSQPDGPRQFQANPEMAELLTLDGIDGSLVTSWAVDGSSASGTGIFVEFFGAMAAAATGEDTPAPVEGTFSLTCE